MPTPRPLEAAGARGVLAMPLDIAEDDAVEAFAAATVGRFDRIDGWVNDAGVIAYGEFTELRSVPPMLSVEAIAAGIEACAESPKIEVTYGTPGNVSRSAEPHRVEGLAGAGPTPPGRKEEP